MNRPATPHLWRAFFALVVLAVCGLAAARLVDEQGRGPLPAGWRIEGNLETAKRVSGSLWFGHNATLVWTLPVSPAPSLRLELEVDYQWVAQVFFSVTGGERTFLVYEDVQAYPAGAPFRVFLDIAGGEMAIGDAATNRVWRKGAAPSSAAPELTIHSYGSRMNIRSARVLAEPGGALIAEETFGLAFDVRNVIRVTAIFAAIWALAALLDRWFWRRLTGRKAEQTAPSFHRALMALATVFLLADFWFFTGHLVVFVAATLIYRVLSLRPIDPWLADASAPGKRVAALLIGLALLPALVGIGLAVWRLPLEQRAIIFPLGAAAGVTGVTLLFRVRETMRFYGTASLLCALLFLASVELALRRPPWEGRLSAANLGADYLPHDSLFWVPKSLFTNADGPTDRMQFRSGPTADAKTPGVYRVMALGGSNTWGQGLDDSEAAQAWPSRLQAELQAALPRGRVEVINAGVGGYSLLQLLILYRQNLQSYDVDLILLYINDNDTAQHFRRGALTMRETYLARANETGGREPPAESLAAVKTALVAARKWLRQYALFNALAYGVAVVRNESGDVATTDEASALLKSVNPVVDYRANLREFIAVAKARGAQVVLIDEVQNTRGKAPDAGTFFAEPMRQTAAEEGVYFLPAARFFNRLPEHVSYFVPWDHVHLNAAGHQAVAEMIARFLFEQQLFPPFN